jgi:hypothetical protein
MDMQVEGVEQPREVRGRKQHGQAAVIELAKVRERIDDLVALYLAAQRSGDELSEAINACAEAAGIKAAPLRKVVAAKAGERFEEKRVEAGQLALLFDEVA